MTRNFYLQIGINIVVALKQEAGRDGGAGVFFCLASSTNSIMHFQESLSCHHKIGVKTATATCDYS